MHAPIRAKTSQPNSSTDLVAGYADDLHTISSALNLPNEPSTEGWVETTSNGRWKGRPTRADRVPDVRGLPLRDALFLLENRGFRVLVEGRGKVKEQSDEPGQEIDKTTGKVITLNPWLNPIR